MRGNRNTTPHKRKSFLLNCYIFFYFDGLAFKEILNILLVKRKHCAHSGRAWYWDNDVIWYRNKLTDWRYCGAQSAINQSIRQLLPPTAHSVALFYSSLSRNNCWTSRSEIYVFLTPALFCHKDRVTGYSKSIGARIKDSFCALGRMGTYHAKAITEMQKMGEF